VNNNGQILCLYRIRNRLEIIIFPINKKSKTILGKSKIPAMYRIKKAMAVKVMLATNILPNDNDFLCMILTV